MRKHYLCFCAFALVICGAGCGGGDDVSSVQIPSAPVATPTAANVTASSQPATVAAPPPVVTTAATKSAASKGGAAPSVLATGVGDFKHDPLFNFRYDDDGKTLDDLHALQRAIENYERSRFDTFEPGDKPKPALTDLKMLVQYGFVKGIPAPPPGKSYSFDPSTQKVALQ